MSIFAAEACLERQQQLRNAEGLRLTRRRAEDVAALERIEQQLDGTVVKKP
ncbi:hypothetical protein [Cupriavidus sp. SS-3]|uniref:hypothetical protein n=1 Tax=Cupriavidus sp. SS-3 TaxID=3109596 RepID=UPI002DB6E1A0|nr:hypothetical protein [Cupriavidus sp. SS-3]MEC3766092.1 hypothetical protein [Cupriavidus sp. SS-3]